MPKVALGLPSLGSWFVGGLLSEEESSSSEEEEEEEDSSPDSTAGAFSSSGTGAPPWVLEEVFCEGLEDRSHAKAGTVTATEPISLWIYEC